MRKLVDKHAPGSFDPDTTEILVMAFEEACPSAQADGVADRHADAREMLGKASWTGPGAASATGTVCLAQR